MTSPWRQSVLLSEKLIGIHQALANYKDEWQRRYLTILLAVEKQLEPEAMHIEILARQALEGEQWEYC
jgi:hypothetical protein